MITHYTKYIVQTDMQQYTTEVSGRFKYTAYDSSDYPVVGDYVNFHITNELEGIIESIVPRTSTLSRLGVSQTGEAQIIASNIDRVFLCMSMNQDFNIKKLRNLLNIAYSTAYETIILLTKKDLTDTPMEYIKQVESITDYPLYDVSVYDPEDIQKIVDVIGTSTCVFIGSSGVGKSTMINAILGTEHFQTNDIRISDAQGRHTTVHRELLTLPSGGAIIDTPGVRVLNSYIVEDMDTHFEDIFEFSEQCKFRDCSHNQEPGCMIQYALEHELLSYDRYEQYQKALKLNEHNIRKERYKERQLQKLQKRR